MFLAFEQTSRDSNYVNCAMEWLFLRATGASKKENDSPKSANQQFRARCESEGLTGNMVPSVLPATVLKTRLGTQDQELWTWEIL